MPRGKTLTVKERGQIEAYRDTNMAKRDIARRIGRSHTVVINYLKDPELYATTKRKGRTPKLSQRQRREIIRKASNSSISLRQIKVTLNLNVSRETVRQVLKTCPFIKYAKRMKVPKLTQAHILRRLSFAMKHIKRIWRHTIFSDEKKFTLDGPAAYNGYWNDSRKEAQYHPTRNFGGGSLMVWAAFSRTGKLQLVFTTCKMTSKDYTQILEQSLIPYVRMHSDEDFTFQQDNAAIHTSRFTQQWFEDHNIDVLDWPARSPDLNPMENLWGILVQRIYYNDQRYDTIDELKAAILMAWENIEKNIIENLVDSMNTRLSEVITKHGNVTTY